MDLIILVVILNFFVICSVLLVQARNLPQKATSQNAVFDEKNSEHWKIQAQWVLKNKLSTPLNTKVAKNVILFLGDGMSITTLAATRVYLGHQHGLMGEELKLSFEAFPYTGLAKTYCVDHNVADSACSATAYLSGVKANSGTVGVSAAVKRGDCAAQKDQKNTVTGLVDWAQKAGKATGVVTTTRVTHATPASSYAHSADRRWESDADLPKYGLPCDDIATQLVRGPVGSRIDVIMGGGRHNFFSNKDKDSEGHSGVRLDSTNLIDEWLLTRDKLGSSATYVFDKKGLSDLDVNDYNSVLGLFSPDHMPYRIEANRDEDPSLMEMTLKAIEMLSRGRDGYFLFVEGGRIDTAHHETKARKALDETAELAKAVEATLKAINTDETLVIVTSDHSHTMTYSGYSKRGTDILGFSTRVNGSDHLPYTTLSYANGPGHKYDVDNNQRHNLLDDDLNNPNYTFPSLVPMARETHGGEDVAVFALGPWAHLFTGNYEQNYVPHAIAYAACMGPGLTACRL